jgi:hypothetical protein
MDRYKATADRRYLLKSRDLYAQAFNLQPANDYYTGINAAAKSLLLGERETAAQLAERVEKIVGTQAAVNDYWKTATVAEVQLLRGNYDKAGQLYQAAVVAAPDDVGSHASTYAQAVLLLNAWQASDEDKAKVLAPFDHIAKAAKA